MKAIVAVSSNDYCIGKDNSLPWRCKLDLKFFKQYTLNNILLAGRKTAQSLPSALKDRQMYIMTTKTAAEIDGLKFDEFKTVKDPHLNINADKMIVIGGQETYTRMLPYINEFVVSVIDEEVEDGDAFFDLEMLEDDFELVETVLPTSNRFLELINSDGVTKSDLQNTNLNQIRFYKRKEEK